MVEVGLLIQFIMHLFTDQKLPGSGIYGWETDEEEDLWEVDLDFNGLDTEECDDLGPEMTVGEHLEWRYFKAERAKELVRFLIFSFIDQVVYEGFREITSSEKETSRRPLANTQLRTKLSLSSLTIS